MEQRRRASVPSSFPKYTLPLTWDLGTRDRWWVSLHAVTAGDFFSFIINLFKHGFYLSRTKSLYALRCLPKPFLHDKLIYDHSE